MSDNVTIARPYAKAIFNHAVAQGKLPFWSSTLYLFTQVVNHSEASKFIRNPESGVSLQVDLLLSLFNQAMKQEAPQDVRNIIQLLVDNKRLLLLPEINSEFEILRAEQEKTVQVDVQSFLPLTSAQQDHLVQTLSLRLQRNVMLNMSIDASLLGGAVIRAGDLVIDGSVRGKLTKLGTDLAA